jgi:uncharacterized protein (AIM24 family)
VDEAPAFAMLQEQAAAAPVTLRTVVGERTFILDHDRLTVRVREDVLARQEGLLAVRGGVRLVPEMKRFRGQTTQKPFGEGGRRMLRASGEGGLVYRISSGQLAVLDLAAESLYLREESVFAFEDVVAFENGRVSSRGVPDLNLVHLRGPGQVVLAVRGELATIEVSGEAPARVPVAALVGWAGALTPRIAPLADVGPVSPGAAEPLAVELSGQGRVLLDEGAAA